MLNFVVTDMKIQFDFMAMAKETKYEKKLIELANSHGIVIGNTWFKQQPMRFVLGVHGTRAVIRLVWPFDGIVQN